MRSLVKTTNGPTLAVLLLLVCAPGQVRAQSALPRASAPESELKKTASWNWPDVAVFQQQIISYIEQRSLPDAARESVEKKWNETSDDSFGPAFLDRLLLVGATIEPRISQLNERLLSTTGQPVVPGDLPWLTSDVPGWMQDAIRLACGRAFAQRNLYDESLTALTGLSVDQVCDPSTLIFYRAISEHHLLKKDACLADLNLLLEREDELPTRYASVAKLMKTDIQPLKADSLDEVSRLMRDVQRRLDLGRVGEKVRDEEQEIVDKLDKLIEDVEKQLQQQQQQSQPGEGNGRKSSQSPLDDSQAAGGNGEGNVDNRDVGDRSGWGNLPPAQRQQAIQRLTEELPSHYRDVIQGYFRQLAKEKQ